MTLRSLFFFDDWCLARRDNIARRLGQPEWVRDATYADPTENPFSYPTVLYDEHRKLWRMFYLGRETMPGAVYRKDEWFLTAESEDGIHWQRPDLTATVPLPSRMRPHEIFDRQRLATAGSVFLDESSPERRFKLPILAIDEDGQRASRLAWSADGYNWQIDHASRWHPGTPDPGFFTYHHAERNSHITLARPSHGDRRIALMETHDWRTWSEPEVIFHPDPLDPPMCEFYGIVVLPYRGIYVGILWMFETDPFDQWWQKLEGKIYGELVYSYDGLRFQRSLRQPFIGLNEPGEYGGGGIYPCSMVVDHEGQIRIYSGGTKGEHFQARTLSRDEPDYAAILLHRLRQDGFVYLESMAGAGYLTTRWVRLHDERLLLNVQAPYGEVRVQLSDIEGQPLPGYTFDQCQPFRGDSTAWQPHWQGQAGLAEHVGTPIRIDVRLYHARLYAIHGDIELVYASDGLRFQRSLRQPFIGLNEPGEYGGGGIYPCSMVVDHEGQIRIYSGGTKGEHFQARTLSRDEPDYAAILLHRLRQDGFVYLESMAGAGYLTTRWVRLHDERLQLNVQAPYGEVRVQLSDIEGQPLPGYTFEQCQPFRGDSTAWQPQWQDQAGLAEHVGTPLRIDVRLYHARLYAIHGDIELVYASNLR